ncbi:hypothetical protein A0H81_11227 [Grifola frondosa]|uniref:Uncharacterized protein n=1 Tax=Grifola frondosa TaxID=5627 RepID=A0A1C7LXL8_GRIFR|nr:hypothetical protein A0H81_11227 [Grifola frondosa]
MRGSKSVGRASDHSPDLVGNDIVSLVLFVKFSIIVILVDCVSASKFVRENVTHLSLSVITKFPSSTEPAPSRPVSVFPPNHNHNIFQSKLCSPTAVVRGRRYECQLGGQTNTTIGRIRRRPVETRPASSRKKRRCMSEESDSGQEKVSRWNIDSISRHMVEISQLYFRLIRSTACTYAEEGIQTCLASEADIQKFTSSATAAPSSPSEAETAPALEVPHIVNATEAPPTLSPPLETHETSHTDVEAQHNLPTTPGAAEQTQQPEEARHIDQPMPSDTPPSEKHISPLVDVEANNEATANITIHPFPAVVEHAQEPEVVQHLDLQDSARSTTNAASSQSETAVDAALVSEEPQTPPTTETASTFPSDTPQSEILQVLQADVAASGEVPKDVCTVPSPEPTFPSDVPPPETLDALHTDVKANDEVLRHSLAVLSPTVEHTQSPEVSQHPSLPTVPTETVKAPMARQVSPPPSLPDALVSSEDPSTTAQGWLFPLSAPVADPIPQTALIFSEGATPITRDPPSEPVEVEMADEGLPPYAPSSAFTPEEYSTTDPRRWSFEEQKAAVVECMPPFVDSIDNSNYIGAMAPQLSGLTRDMPWMTGTHRDSTKQMRCQATVARHRLG